MGALLLLAIPTTFFWATYEQQGNTIALWADPASRLNKFYAGIGDGNWKCLTSLYGESARR